MRRGGGSAGKGDEKEKPEKQADEKSPDGPEAGKGEDGGKGKGSGGPAEAQEKGKKRFVINERDVQQASPSGARKALLFAMVCVAGYFIASGSLTNQKDIKAHLGSHGFVKEEESDTLRGEEKLVLDNMRKNGKGLATKSDEELKKSGTLEDYFLNPEGGGGVSFERSPRKRGREVRAIEAIADWNVGFEANRQLIYVSNTRYPHRGVLQLALGEQARMERRGFEFDRAQMRWVITTRNFLRAFEGRTADEVDEEVVREVLMASIDKGNEDKPDFNGGGGGGRD